jgi:hypothetical protein
MAHIFGDYVKWLFKPLRIVNNFLLVPDGQKFTEVHLRSMLKEKEIKSSYHRIITNLDMGLEFIGPLETPSSLLCVGKTYNR